MSEESRAYYWANDPYWTEALGRFTTKRDAGQRSIILDIEAIERVLFNGDGPAYRLMEGMASVQELEAWEGQRGAPRLVLALLQHLSELR
jgi:hypothetical protein